MNMAPMSVPKTITPAQAATQKTRRPATLQVVERVSRRTLANQEGDQPGKGDRGQSEGQRSPVRHSGEVDRQNERRDEHDGEDAAEVVDRIGRFVDMARDEPERHQQRDDGERQREQEDGAPPEVLQECT
jgi:hypothetical protein